MKINIPSPLRSYTQNKFCQATGGTIGEVLTQLDSQYKGIKFRIIDEQENIRTHIRIFVNQELITTLDTPVTERDEVHIIAALSGG